MTKAIVSIGYTSYVLDLKDVVTIAEMMSKAEIYENKYRSGGNSTNHIYPNESADFATIRVISDDLYRMAKLAGKPDKE